MTDNFKRTAVFARSSVKLWIGLEKRYDCLSPDHASAGCLFLLAVHLGPFEFDE
jgi:hypothetical protein